MTTLVKILANATCFIFRIYSKCSHLPAPLASTLWPELPSSLPEMFAKPSVCFPTVSVAVLFLKPPSAYSSLLLKRASHRVQSKSRGLPFTHKAQEELVPHCFSQLAPCLCRTSSRHPEQQASTLLPPPPPRSFALNVPFAWDSPLPKVSAGLLYLHFLNFSAWKSSYQRPSPTSPCEAGTSPLAFLSYLSGISYIP